MKSEDKPTVKSDLQPPHQVPEPSVADNLKKEEGPVEGSVNMQETAAEPSLQNGIQFFLNLSFNFVFLTIFIVNLYLFFISFFRTI